MSKKYQGKFSSSAQPEKPENHQHIPQQNKKKKSKLRVWQWILLSVLLVLLALIVAIVIFVFTKLNKINRVDPNESRLTPEQAAMLTEDDTVTGSPDAPEVNPDDVTWATNDGTVIGTEDSIVNILLIGQDRRPGEARARSDSMILVSFNKDTNKITLASFLRDNYVQIPGGYQDNRLNTAYAIGGMSLLDETLEVNFGVSIDANVEVDFSGFSEIIDILGGVDIELTSAEASHLNSNNGWSLSAGVNHLDGEQALAYARIRKLDSDFGRTSRQRNVLTALIDEFKNISLGEALELVDEIFPLLTTDMSNMDIIGYVTDLLPMLSSAEIDNVHIPGDGNYYNATIRGMSVLVPDLEACRQQLADALQ